RPCRRDRATLDHAGDGLILTQWCRSRHDEPPGFAMLNLTRLHLGIAHESQFQGLGISRCGKSRELACGANAAPAAPAVAILRRARREVVVMALPPSDCARRFQAAVWLAAEPDLSPTAC